MAQRPRNAIERFAEFFYNDPHNLNDVIARLEFESVLQSSALSPRDRQMYGLRYVLGFEQDEIARILRVSQQTVSLQLDRCLDIIKACLCGGEMESYQVPRKDWYIRIDPVFDAWNEHVLHNDGFWWYPSDQLRKFVVTRWPHKTKRVELHDYERPNQDRPPKIMRYWKGRRIFDDDDNFVYCAPGAFMEKIVYPNL